MATIATAAPPATYRRSSRGRTVRRRSAFATLARRRLALSARTPREILVPLLTPILFARGHRARARQDRWAASASGLDYMSFVAVGTIGLLVPLSCILGGIGVIVDRESGAQRDLLAAPIQRSLLVFGNLAVALADRRLPGRRADRRRGAARRDFDTARDRACCGSLGAALCFAVAMYGVAETLATRIPKQEEYVGAAAGHRASCPGSSPARFFPISALPAALTASPRSCRSPTPWRSCATASSTTAATGLHDIWGMANPTPWPR